MERTKDPLGQRGSQCRPRMFVLWWEGRYTGRFWSEYSNIENRIDGRQRTEAWETKSVTEMSFPLWASIKASNHSFVSSFWIWTTWVRATEPSGWIRYSRVAFCPLYLPPSVSSVSGNTDFHVIVGSAGAIMAVSYFSAEFIIRKWW